MSTSLSRRGFLTRLAAVGVAVSTPRPFAISPQRALRVGVVDHARPPRDARQMGVTLGVEEARHAATLFRDALSLEVISLPAAAPLDGLSVVIGNADDEHCSRLANVDGPLVFNVACGSNALRASCPRTLFHVALSDAARRAASAGTTNALEAVVPWHPSLTRFGADTLNQRFQNRFGREMTSDAWAAWFAVKVSWEAALRTRTTDHSALLQFLSSGAARFDGHKGVPLSFRDDHELEQPIYILRGGRALETSAPETSRPSRCSARP